MMLRTLTVMLAIIVMAGTAHAQQGKPLRDMSPTERRLFIQNGGLQGKCQYDRCYARCMDRNGMDQFSNAKCAQRCVMRCG
jgi:hypothetical protein